MDDLKAILDELEDAELDYVLERSRTTNDTQALHAAGIARSTFYRWPEERRAELLELAQQIKRQMRLRALMVLEAAVEEAARAKVEALHGKDARARQQAASEILDRVLGKPTQRQEVEHGGGQIEFVIVQRPVEREDADDAAEDTD